MPKPENIIIQIPEPCTESWDAMTPDGCGRFCALCEKTVIDFTQMTDQEVVKVMMNNPGISCGRFNESQIERPLLVSNARSAKSFPYISKMAASLLLMQTFVSNVFAQKKDMPRTEQTASDLATENAPVLVLEGTLKDYIDEGQREIFTKLKKDSNFVTSPGVRNYINNFEPHLVGMEISVSGVNYVKYTDKDGYFRFVLPDSFRGKKLVVSASYQPTSSPEKEGTTLRSEEVTFGNNESIKTIELFRYRMHPLNSVKIEGFYLKKVVQGGYMPHCITTQKPTLWQNVKRIFKKKSN